MRLGRKNGVWYRVDEYYFNSRTQGFQKTDEEHYDGLEKLIDGRKIECVIVDPSAASFIEVIRRHGKYTVVSADRMMRDLQYRNRTIPPSFQCLTEYRSTSFHCP